MNKAQARLLKHPLFLLIVGAAISSVAIPFMAGDYERRKARAKARNERAINIIQRDNDTSSLLNLLQLKLDSVCRQRLDQLELYPTTETARQEFERSRRGPHFKTPSKKPRST